MQVLVNSLSIRLCKGAILQARVGLRSSQKCHALWNTIALSSGLRLQISSTVSNTFLGILTLADLDDLDATCKAPTTLAQAVCLAWDRSSQWFYPGLIVFELMLATNALVLAAARTKLGLTM